MAGSILAGCAVEPGRYQPARWALAGCWAVGHTDSGSGWSGNDASWEPGRPIGHLGDGRAVSKPGSRVAHEPVAGGVEPRSAAGCRRQVAHSWLLEVEPLGVAVVADEPDVRPDLVGVHRRPQHPQRLLQVASPTEKPPTQPDRIPGAQRPGRHDGGVLL